MPLVEQGKAFNGQVLCEAIWQYFNSLLNCFPLPCKSIMPLQLSVFPKYFTEAVTQVLIQNKNDYKCLFHKIMFPLY